MLVLCSNRKIASPYCSSSMKLKKIISVDCFGCFLFSLTAVFDMFDVISLFLFFFGRLLYVESGLPFFNIFFSLSVVVFISFHAEFLFLFGWLLYLGDWITSLFDCSS